MNTWRESNNQHIRDVDGKPVNLNSRQGAEYVLELQRRLAEQEPTGKPRRGRPRKGAPKETK